MSEAVVPEGGIEEEEADAVAEPGGAEGDG
jgi:hypothetical protein